MALTYESAGVNKHEGYNEVNLIKKFIKKRSKAKARCFCIKLY
mgnify:CR=1 FL=1